MDSLIYFLIRKNFILYNKSKQHQMNHKRCNKSETFHCVITSMPQILDSIKEIPLKQVNYYPKI